MRDGKREKVREGVREGGKIEIGARSKADQSSSLGTHSLTQPPEF